MRFKELGGDNVIEEFNKLSHTSTIKDYQEQFEILHPLVSVIQPSLKEVYFVSSFISGLKEEIKCLVQRLEFPLVDRALSLA